MTVGATHQQELEVVAGITVPALPAAMGDFASMPAVLSTPMVVAFVEATCVGLLHPFLDEGEVSLGVHVAVSHLAATPPGGRVTARVEVTAVDGGTVDFAAVVEDDVTVVSRGTHRRAVVPRERFLAGLARHPAVG